MKLLLLVLAMPALCSCSMMQSYYAAWAIERELSEPWFSASIVKGLP